MSKFKIGDRVASYTYSNRIVGIVKDIGTDDLLIKTGELTTCWRHIKQCRKIVDKPRRRLWVVFRGAAFVYTSLEKAKSEWPSGENSIVEFVEVKKK